MNNEWKMVPVDATSAMIDAAAKVEEEGYDAMHKAMLAAAPALPAGDVEVLAMNKDCAICLALGDICVSCEEVEASAPPLGDVIVIGHVSYVGDGFVRVTLEGPSPGVQTELVDRAHVTRLTAERDGLLAEVRRLSSVSKNEPQIVGYMDDSPDGEPLITLSDHRARLAKVMQPGLDAWQKGRDGMRDERDALQSELTKALEDLRLGKVAGAAIRQQAEDFKALSWERGQELTKARELLSSATGQLEVCSFALREVATSKGVTSVNLRQMAKSALNSAAAIFSQSAPAAKGGHCATCSNQNGSNYCDCEQE